jgi:tetratricopeptide (TPR) repeat protein
MRLSLVILASLAVLAHAKESREAAVSTLQKEARAKVLVEGIADDIAARHYDRALKKADEALRLRPDDPVVLNARGAALSRLRRFDEAKAAFEICVKADPQSFPARYNLAEILALQKNHLDALGEFLALRSAFGASPLLKFNIYMCYAAAGRKEDAAAALDAMLYPLDGAAWYYAHAADRFRAGKPAEARRLMKIADAIHGDDAASYRDWLVDFELTK